MNEMKTGIVRYKRSLITTVVAAFLLASILSAFIVVKNASAHIDEGVGDPRQLYSYFDSDASTKINFGDDGIGRDMGNYDEWEGAYVRNITITNFAGDDRFCYLFLANDDNFLYIGIVYEAGNTGADNYVRIYFDEGDGGGAYDGSHDDALTVDNENFVHRNRGGGILEEDGYYDGVAWQTEASVDFISHVAWGVSYMNFEFRIPLDNGVDSGTGSDLNVASTDELGIFFEINVTQSPGSDLHFWDLTGSDPTDPSLYGDIRLGLQRKTATVYSTFANTGNPIIDGDITNDFAYANAFSREIPLTNFMWTTLSSTIYMCENPGPTNDEIFIGMVIYTDNSDAADYLRVYTDQDHAVGPPYGGKDGVLSDGVGDFENFEQLNGDNGYTDGYWDAAGEWLEDSGATDETDGEGAVTFMNFAGSSNDRYEFEFRLPYSPASTFQVDGDHDLWINSPELIGFLIEFYDSSAPAGEQFFYWDLTTNLNAIKTRATAGEIWLSTGWAFLQTGGPALKPITPIEGATVFGNNYIFRVEAEDEDGYDGVNFVGFQVEGQTSWISLVRESINNGIWFTYWDTTAFMDGTYNITIVAQDNEGIVVKKVISVTIANGGAAGAPPTVSLTMPVKGSTNSGTVEFQATTTGIASSVEFYVDDQIVGTMTSIGGDTWQFFLDSTFWDDGMHIVKVVAKNAVGEGADAGLYVFENFVPGTPLIVSVLPGQYLEGTFTFQVAASSGDVAGVDFTLSNNLGSEVISNVSLGYNSASGYYEIAVNTETLADGDYTCTAYAYDDAANVVASDTVPFRIDNTPPDLAIISPANYAYVSGSVTINVNATDVFYDSTVYSAAGSGWTDISEPWDTTAIEDGTYSILIKTTDLSGKETTGQLHVTVDNNAPEISINIPVADQFVQGTFTFQVLASDGIGVDEVRISLTNSDSATTVINDVPIGYNSGTGYYEYTLDTTIFADGNYTFECTAYDTVGQDSGALTVDFAIDNNDPILTITSPIEGQLITGSLFINAYAEDVFLSDVSYSVDGGGWVDISVQWQTSDLEDGTHTLSVSATDSAGHMVVQAVNVRTDNNGPELFVVKLPKENERVGSAFLIQLEIRDAMAVSEVTYRFDTNDPVRMFVNKETDFYEAEVVTDESGHDLTDGEYTLYLKATDTTGLSTEMTRAIYVDNSGPQITFTSPSNGQTVDNDVRFKVNVADGADVEEVYIRINKGAWIEMAGQEGSDTYTYTWNSRGVYNGEYDVDIRAVDGLGNENKISATINVDNFPWTIFIIFIIGLVVLAILLVVSRSRGPKAAPPKKKKEAEAPEETGEEEVPPAPEKAMISELSEEDEDLPPPPEKASIVELGEDSRDKEVYECPECGAQLTEFDVICPKCGVELVNDENKSGGKDMDKLEPPAPEEET